MFYKLAKFTSLKFQLYKYKTQAIRLRLLHNKKNTSLVYVF